MVSVIIPVYNRAKIIERSVKSVLNQTVNDLEIIIVDDCSDDGLKDAIDCIEDSRVRYVRLDMHSGACAARNRGVEEARGDIIAFQDSDDEWCNQKLEIQLKAMNDNDADICFCSLRRHYLDDAKVIVWPEVENTSSRFMDNTVLRRKSYASTQTIVAKRKVCEEITFDPELIKSQDYDWMIRASERYSVFFVANALVEQYLQSDSISLAGYGKIVESREFLLKKYQKLALEDPEFRLHLMKQLAYYKSLDGKNAAKEYKIVYSLEKNLHNFICVTLSSLGMLQIIRKIKLSKK